MVKVALTGHRNDRLHGKNKEILKWIQNTLLDIHLQDSKIQCLCGGAEGADELFAEIAAFGTCPADLIFYLPCEGYRFFALEKYISKAKQVIPIFKNWIPGGDEIRDRRMVEDCDILLAVWDGIRIGGTWETIKHAQDLNKKIICLNVKEL